MRIADPAAWLPNPAAPADRRTLIEEVLVVLLLSVLASAVYAIIDLLSAAAAWCLRRCRQPIQRVPQAGPRLRLRIGARLPGPASGASRRRGARGDRVADRSAARGCRSGRRLVPGRGRGRARDLSGRRGAWGEPVRDPRAADRTLVDGAGAAPERGSGRPPGGDHRPRLPGDASPATADGRPSRRSWAPPCCVAATTSIRGGAGSRGTSSWGCSSACSSSGGAERGRSWSRTSCWTWARRGVPALPPAPAGGFS